MKTTKPIAAAEGDLKPEWIKVAPATRSFGVGTKTLYSLIGEQKIKSVCVREHGARRGVRLIAYDSLCTLLERAARGECI
jgi:hypothetical protein